MEDYWTKELSKLLGGKAVKVVTREDYGVIYYGLKFTFIESGLVKTLWFLRDEEGNGPGSFDIEVGYEI